MSRLREFIKQLSFGGLGISLASLHSFTSIKGLVPGPNSGKSLRILFQGDSITDGGRWQNSHDWNHLVGQSYPYLISAKIGYDYPARDLQFFNRGISGNTVRDLKARWQKDCLDIKPDVLSILVGINDISKIIHAQPDPSSIESYEKDYREILDQARKANPDLVLVLMDPFVFNLGSTVADFEKYHESLTAYQKVVKRLAVAFKAIHIPLGEKFKQAEKFTSPSHWSWDGIHPMPAGHELIARGWIKAVSKVIGIY